MMYDTRAVLTFRNIQTSDLPCAPQGPLDREDQWREIEKVQEKAKRRRKGHDVADAAVAVAAVVVAAVAVAAAVTRAAVARTRAAVAMTHSRNTGRCSSRCCWSRRNQQGCRRMCQHNRHSRQFW